MRELRDYQTVAFNSTLAHLDAGVPGVLVQSAVGTGKTTIGAALADELARRHAKIAWLCGREELADQAVEDLEGVGLRVARDHGAYHFDVANLSDVDVVVMTPASMVKRIAKYARDAFGYLIIDECHHVAAATWAAVTAYFVNAQRIGLSATPSRADGKSLSEFFPVTAFTMSTAEAMQKGWLSSATVQEVFVKGFSADTVRDDFRDADLAEAWMRHGAILSAVAVIAESIGTRQGLVFTPSIESAEVAAKHLSERGIVSVVLSGNTPKRQRRAILQDFKAGKVQVIANAMLLTEGVNLTMISYIAVLRPTTNLVLLNQMLGRGLRLHPGKLDCLIQYFSPDQLTKKPYALPGDLFRGASFKQLNDIGENARKKAEEEAQAKRAAEAAEAAAEGRRIRAVGVEREITNIPPERLFRGLLGVWWETGTQLLDWQINWLTNNWPRKWQRVTTREQFEVVREAVRNRYAANLCSLKQAAILKQVHLNPNVSRADADYAIPLILRHDDWYKRPAPGVLSEDPRFQPGFEPLLPNTVVSLSASSKRQLELGEP